MGIFRRKISLPATILTFFAVCVLAALGSWQVQRLKWKTALLERLDAAYASSQDRILERADVEDADPVYGRVQGVFLPDKAFLAGIKVREGKSGKDLIVPLRTESGDVLVNFGWTDVESGGQAFQVYTVRSVWVEGLLRKPSWNMFTPENRPAENIWYRLDIPAIAQAKGLDRPWPLVVYAERISTPLGEGLPNNPRFYPDNNHLQYAVFWFAMAGVLIVIYILRFVINPQESH